MVSILQRVKINAIIETVDVNNYIWIALDLKKEFPEGW